MGNEEEKKKKKKTKREKEKEATLTGTLLAMESIDNWLLSSHITTGTVI